MEPFLYSSGCDPRTVTLCTAQAFVEAWARGTNGLEVPYSFKCRDGAGRRTLYALQKPHRFGLKSLSIGTSGLCGSPGWTGKLSVEMVRGVLKELQSKSVVRLRWNVASDHGELAEVLKSSGLRWWQRGTFVQPLESDYDKVFARYNRTTRRQVHSLRREDRVRVRATTSAGEITQCYRFDAESKQLKGRPNPRPAELWIELARIPGGGRFLVAECEGRIIAGVLLLRDGLKVTECQLGYDRACSKLLGTTAVNDAAIQWACSIGATSFDWGSCVGQDSLRHYKESWGALLRMGWCFEWVNPFWEFIRRFKGKLAAARFGHWQQPPALPEPGGTSR